MRKALAFIAAAALLVVLPALPAHADLAAPTPAAGTIVEGTVPLHDNGSRSGGVNYFLGSCNGFTRIEVLNSANAVVASAQVDGAGGASPGPVANLNWNSEGQPNGNYTVRGTNRKKTSVCFGNQDTTTTRALVLRNRGFLTYNGQTARPTGTNATVSATLVNQNGTPPPAGQTVTFALSGSGSVNATTNAAGLASANLAVTGAPRGATLTTSYGNATSFITSTSATTPFEVQAIPTSTALTSSVNPSAFGQLVQYTATVSTPQPGGGTPSGSVQFQVDGSNLGVAVPLSGAGVATSQQVASSVGVHNVTATYLPTPLGNYGASSNQLTQTVNKASTSTTLVPSSPTVTGEPVTFTANVAVLVPGLGTPTGSITFQQDGSPIGIVPLTGLSATSAPIAIGAANSPYTITAIYSGDGSFSTSQGTTTHTVNRAATSHSLASGSAPSVSGETLAFTSTVTADGPGAGTPTGDVVYTVDGDPLGQSTMVGGQATSPDFSQLDPGTYTITAAYSGDPNFAPSGASFEQIVNKAQTTSALTASNNPSVYGQPVTYNVTVETVAPGTGTPFGNVVFTVGGVAQAPVALDVNGQATSVVVDDLPVGDHVVSVSYEGSARSETSGDSLTQSVEKADTTTAIASSVTPSVFGQEVTFTADITVNAPGAATPTGTVTFLDGSTALATVPVVEGSGTSQATFSTSALSVGSHAVTAEYSGDGSLEASAATTTQGVNKASTTTSVAPNGPIVQGQPVTFTATVTAVAPGAGTRTGSVQFKLNGTSIGGPVAVAPAGTATSIAVNGLTPGSYTVTAIYSGDGNFLGSTGSVGQNVSTSGTTTSLTSSSNPSPYGGAVTLTATVAVPSPGTGNPTGTVAFYDGEVLLGTDTLASSGGAQQAALTVPAFSVGTHALRADYLGEFGFTPSSATLTQQVAQNPTTVTLASSQNPSVFNAPITLSATVSSAVVNPNAVTGNVAFYDGTTLLAIVAVTATPSGAAASTTVSAFSVGNHPLTAVYSGDSVYGAGTSSVVTQVVAKRPTTLTSTKSASSVITATLSTAQGPLAGKTLVVKTGTVTLCTVTTNAAGQANCAAGSYGLQVILQGYTVTYAGDASYIASSASGN